MAKHVTYRLRLLIVALLVAVSANAQQLGLKTNVLYWATTTPNIGLELQTGRKHTIQAFYGINPWKFKDNKSIRHWVIQPEYRYWFCRWRTHSRLPVAIVKALESGDLARCRLRLHPLQEV